MVSRNHGVDDGSLPSRFISAQGLFRGLGFSLFAAVVTALFLVRHGAEALPLVYLISAAIMPLLYLGYVSAEYRVPTGAHLVAVLAGVSIVVGVSAGLAASASTADGSGWMLYLAMVLLFVPSTYGLLAEDVQLGMFYDARQLSGVMPRLLMATTFGVVLAAVLVPAVSVVLPLNVLLTLAVAAFVAMTAAAVLLVVNYASLFSARPSLGEDRGARSLRTRPQNGAGLLELYRDRFFRLTFVHQVLRQTSILLVHYLFLDLVARGFADDASSVASLLAAVMAAVQTVGVAMLLIAGIPLLFRYGLRFGLIANPLLMSILVFGLLALTAFGDPSDRTRFWMITAAWSIERALSIAVTDPSMTAVTRVQPARLRYISLTANDGLATPVAAALAGSMLLLMIEVLSADDRALLILVLVATTAWGAASLLLAGGYRATVVRRLQHPTLTGLDIPVETAESHAAALALLGGGPQKAALGLDMLTTVGGELYSDALLRLLSSADDDRTLVTVIDRLGEERLQAGFDGLTARLGNNNSTPVRVAAMSALVAVEPYGGGAAVEPLLNDEDQEIRIGAILALLGGAVLRHHDVALGSLAIMVHSNTAEKRRAAAMILGRTAPAGHRELLANLLTDNNLEVRAAAIEAIGLLNLSGHTPAVLDALEDPGTRRAAAGAVKAFGNGAVPGAAVALAREDLSEHQAVRILDVLAARPTHGTTSLIAEHLSSKIPSIRAAAITGLVGNPYLDSSRLTTPDRMNRLVNPVLVEEGARAAELFEAVGPVPDRPEFDTLVRSLTQLAECHATNVFQLLAVRYRRPELAGTNNQIKAGGRSAAMAKELIDSVAGDQDRQLVASLLGRRQRALPGVHGPKGDLPKVLSVCDDDWTAAAAVHGAALAGLELGSILRPDGVIDPMQEQTLSWSRRRVIAGATGAEHSATLKRNGRTVIMAIVEKVDLLRNCVLFSETSDRDLIDLAERAEQLTIGPGDSVQLVGQPVDALYVIVHGELEEAPVNGEPVVRHSGEVIGALELVRSCVATSDVMALRTVELLSLSGEVLRAEIDQRPGMARNIMSALAAAADGNTQATTAEPDPEPVEPNAATLESPEPAPAGSEPEPDFEPEAEGEDAEPELEVIEATEPEVKSDIAGADPVATEPETESEKDTDGTEIETAEPEGEAEEGPSAADVGEEATIDLTEEAPAEETAKTSEAAKTSKTSESEESAEEQEADELSATTDLP